VAVPLLSMIRAPLASLALSLMMTWKYSPIVAVLLVRTVTLVEGLPAAMVALLRETAL
jgi:hypothetical protein